MANGLKPNALREMQAADIILMELSTPIEFIFRGLVLNNDRLNAFMRGRLASTGERRVKLARAWQNALQKCMDADGERRALLDALDQDGIDDELVLALVKETRTNRQEANDIRDCLAAIRDLLPGVPMGMVLYTFRYMPDGRPIDWPAGFRESVIEASKSLRIPIYDPVSFVQKHGVAAAMVPNSPHYTNGFYEVITTEYLVFMARLIGKPKFHRLVRAHGVPRLRKLRAEIAAPT